VRPASKAMADRGDEHPSGPILEPASEISDVDLAGWPVIPVALEPDMEPAGEAATRRNAKGVSGDE
jgi:hypothetical protein